MLTLALLMSAILTELKLPPVGIGGLNILCNARVQIDRVIIFIVVGKLIRFGVRFYRWWYLCGFRATMFYLVDFFLKRQKLLV